MEIFEKPFNKYSNRSVVLLLYSFLQIDNIMNALEMFFKYFPFLFSLHCVKSL